MDDGIYLAGPLKDQVPVWKFLESIVYEVRAELSLDARGTFLRMKGGNYHLSICIDGGCFVVERNGIRAEVPVKENEAMPGWFAVSAAWKPTSIMAEVNSVGKTVQTEPSLPSNELLRWAREQAILKINCYDSQREFATTSLNGLHGLSDKITTTNMVSAFWDLQRSNKIDDGKPKLEVHTQPTIYGLLYEFAIAKGLEINPESAAGSGNIDFLLTGISTDRKSLKACVEVKNAHSTDIIHGATKQLPQYMKMKGTDIGFYVVPTFWGKYFPEKNRKDLGIAEAVRQAGLQSKVRVVPIDVSWPTPPSKL